MVLPQAQGEYSQINAVAWEDGRVIMLDQRLLPAEEHYAAYDSCSAVAQAIREMVVRGAPAIGVAAAYGVVLAAAEAWRASGAAWRPAVQPLLRELEQARPTAVNLHWAVERMRGIFNDLEGDPVPVLLGAARAIHEQDRAANHAMGDIGAGIIGCRTGVLTHCNAGALATGGYGTALGVIRSAQRNFGLTDIFVCETRPWLQGARLTAWELARDNIPATLITDSTAAMLMGRGKISWVIVGADRIAANGDTANKIGTYSHALAARHHGLKFMVVAPTSTIDSAAATGAAIPIEERSGAEFYGFANAAMAPETTRIYSPVFDVTPACLIDVLVTEKGAVHAPDREKIAAILK